jgi:putative membrane protein
MKYIVKLLVVAGALLLAAQIFNGITVDNFWPSAVVAALVMGVLNVTVKPIIHLFALPVTILTLGLFSLVINIVIFWLITFLPGVSISGFFSALGGLLVVSIAGWIADMIFKG